MKTLGLSFDFHDASAAIVDREVLIALAAEEHFTLQKHDPAYPVHAIESVMSLAGLDAAGLDTVAYYEQPHHKFTRVLHSSFSSFPRGAGLFTNSMKKWLGDTLWTHGKVAARLGIDPRRVTLVPHHHSHIAQAFSNSPFDEAAVLVVDGVGEWTCTTLATASRSGGLKIIEQYDYPASIGLVYSAFTAFLGFKPNSGEASTMALSAYGRPLYVEEVEKVLRAEADGSYEVCTDFLNLLSEGEGLFTANFRRVFGEPRHINSAPYAFDALQEEEQSVAPADQRYADIAASLQVVLTRVLLGLCKRLRRLSGMADLCFAGGVALNCLSNTEILKHAGFRGFYIPSDPGDGGAAAGAAAIVGGFSVPCPRASVYLGPLPMASSVESLLDSTYLQSLASQNLGEGKPCSTGIRINRVDLGKLPDIVAEELSGGAIVGWVQGRLESGPRALGNRSLLMDPSNVEAVRRMSRLVKSHSQFRPYALSIAAEDASRVLDCSFIDQPTLRWMQTIWPVRDSVKKKLRAAVHADGTTRPQVCHREDNPLYWELLTAFGRRNGVAALLNTSFNERSMPIVATSLEALMTFLRTGIDLLVIEDLVIRKSYAT